MLIISILLLLRMSAYAYALMKTNLISVMKCTFLCLFADVVEELTAQRCAFTKRARSYFGFM